MASLCPVTVSLGNAAYEPFHVAFAESLIAALTSCTNFSPRLLFLVGRRDPPIDFNIGSWSRYPPREPNDDLSLRAISRGEEFLELVTIAERRIQD
ncbi:hypothetical protein EYZ11_005574 [Aspergillus tanneri]|uniref:Uncharacterized protein n=1 Tax=Aspergillus tanneri TaxID=1220188 RepID=A0A4S3JI62_9EURO|nr:hypothetical protein EYZ11_005574 [Aspergillus tanneri]